MRSLVREAIDEGARGFTTGLSYAPGLFASVEELAALAGVAAERGLTVPHPHALRRPRRPGLGRGGDRHRRASRGRSSTSRTCTRARTSRSRRRTSSWACSTTPAARGARGDVRPDDVPARRRRMGPVAAGLGARRRQRRHGGDHPRPCLPGAPDRGAVEPGRLLAEGLGRPGHLQGEPAGERAPQRPDDRGDRPRTRPGADRHRTRPRPRGRPVLDRPDDQGPGSPRPPGREPAVRADRRRVREPSRDAPGLRPHAQELRDVPARARVVRPRPRRPDARGGGPQDHRRARPTPRARPIGACSRRGWPPTSSSSIRRRSGTGRPRRTRPLDPPGSTGSWSTGRGR